jgi:predicted flap endonuclease-1-like 5' DNA nuclease
MSKIEEIEGVGPAYAEKLATAGIKSVADMLEKCATRKGRAAVAEATGISDQLILKWANHCDLMRIDGVGPEFAELLEAAGVDTVKELRNRNAENLAKAMADKNEEKKLTRVTPSAERVAKWVAEAKTLDPIMTY